MCYCFWNSGDLRNLSSGMHAYMAGMSPSNPSLQLQDFEGCFLLEFKLEKYFKLYSWSLLFIISILKFVKLTLNLFFFSFFEIIRNILTYRNSRLGASTPFSLSINLERKKKYSAIVCGFFLVGVTLFISFILFP